ncbi:FecR domain-containing protein [Marinobacterium sp. xm-m-312]|uniref:FecR family protein n=1 Tax=Marinobacterium sp. xm-m-312 TaxID=2497741 RepID=UPI0015691B57|nr:FecR family protein [Marinobacterium sp. xm-m-312]NRQ22349.1 FecR protein [Marinobacterium sp. xm-m-312]
MYYYTPRNLNPHLFCGLDGYMKSIKFLIFPFYLLVTILLGMQVAIASEIAKATYLVGDVKVERQGTTISLQENGSIFEGDALVTGADGIVHIHFVDGALISARPGTKLQVVRYFYDEAAPENSEIKLELIRGVARSISGKGAQHAKDKYRLNTPVAAIGVRGTDYEVFASDTGLQASVNSGGIVVAPYSSECLQSSLGPCGEGFVELFAGDSRVVVVGFDSNEARLMSVIDAIKLLQQQGELDKASASNDLGTAEPIKDLAESDSKSDDTTEATKIDDVEPLAESAQIASNLSSDLVSRQLVWGRWSGAVSADELALDYSSAKIGRASVLGNTEYGLFRAGKFQSMPNEGVIDFSLQGFQAEASSNGASSKLANLGGELKLDFGLGAYSTDLLMHSALTDYVSLSESGVVSSNGVFVTRTPNQWVAGALSPDLSEAAYFFQLNSNGFLVEGTTLWNKQ